jgi:hypothetical protein
MYASGIPINYDRNRDGVEERALGAIMPERCIQIAQNQETPGSNDEENEWSSPAYGKFNADASRLQLIE